MPPAIGAQGGGRGGGSGRSPKWDLIKIIGFACLAIVIEGYLINDAAGACLMDPFVEGFFHIHKYTTTKSQQLAAAEHGYCRLSEPRLIFFSVSFFIAAALSSVTFSLQKYGPKRWMEFGAGLAIVGAIMDFLSPYHLAVLMAGRIFHGLAAGILVTAVPSYLAEIAAASERGWVICWIQVSYKIGALLANSFGYLMIEKVKGGDLGWKLSLSAIPLVLGVIFLIGAEIVLPDTPHRVGSTESDYETENGAEVELGVIRATTGSDVCWKREYVPMIIVGILLPAFIQFTGVNVIGPIVFQAVGFDRKKALQIEMINCAVGVLGPVIAMFLVDRLGRKVLFAAGGTLMVIALLVLGFVEVRGGVVALRHAMLPPAAATFAFGFGISSGPLGTLTQSEMYPAEIRRLGQAMSAALTMVFSGSMSGASLPLLCLLKHNIFFLFAGMAFVQTLFVLLFVPEMRCIHLNEMVQEAWRPHWCWRRFYNDQDEEGASGWR